MKKIILPLILVFLIGTFVFAKMLSSNVNKETEAEKDLLESIQLVDMNGNDYTFSKDKNIYISNVSMALKVIVGVAVAGTVFAFLFSGAILEFIEHFVFASGF